jgi:hypothetical protein
VIFPCRIGFSGTPSDLLPVEMGPCVFERGDDGRIVHTLTNPSVMVRTALSLVVPNVLGFRFPSPLHRDHERTGPPSLQTLPEPILLCLRVCSRGWRLASAYTMDVSLSAAMSAGQRVVMVAAGWTVGSLLRHVATAVPPFHALIDSGALITGMSNLRVRYPPTVH